MNSRRLSGFASAVLVAAACVATGANAASQVVTPEPDNNTVASWTAAILEAPVAMVQGVSPTNVMTSFPGSVLVPGVPESPFSDMAITQAGWLASSLGSPNPNYEIDLSNPGGRSGQVVGRRLPE